MVVPDVVRAGVVHAVVVADVVRGRVVDPVVVTHVVADRVVGTRERIGKRDGVWRDTVFLERRSEVVT